MLSELSYRHQAKHLPQPPSSRHLIRPETAYSIHPELSEERLQLSPSTSTQNASFRERCEAQQQRTHSLPGVLTPTHNVLSSAPKPNDSGALEHMLRRKTPNGTLAAGYEGSPEEWAKRPHAMKHFMLPISQPAASTPFLSSLAIQPAEQPALRTVQSIGPSTHLVQGSRHQCQSSTLSGATTNIMQSDLGREYRDLTLEGIDSVLNQSSLHTQPFNFAAKHDVPTVLQPMWPPCLGPTSIQTPGPFGPYWPNGAFEPYRPAPIRDPRFQIRSWTRYASTPTQTQSAVSQKSARSHSFEGGKYLSTKDPALAFDNVQDNFSNNSMRSKLQQGNLPQVFRTKLALGSDPWLGLAVPECGSAENSHVNVSGTPALVQHDTTNIGGQAQFKERILTWAHQIYCSLLSAIEHSRREKRFNDAQGHAGSSCAQSPRRPYPSWSNKQRQDNDPSSKRRGSEVDLSFVFGSYTHDSRCLDQAGHVRKGDMVCKAPVFQDYSTYNATEQGLKTPNTWLPEHHYSRPHQLPPYSSYVPAQLSQDCYTDSPSAAAANAMEILGRLCQESHWEWIDGMLLNGCLAYGLGDYSKAMRWYLKILQRDQDDVEAMSNLAATLLSLGRRHEAEQYWMRSIKLRPSYFEAVEHLVGLLHEEHRGREAVRVIEYVESSLSNKCSPTRGVCPPQHGLGLSGYAIPPSENGRLLALIHGKGNVLYHSGDNDGAAKAFEQAILIGSGQSRDGIRGLIRNILKVFSQERQCAATVFDENAAHGEPILLPPEAALETSRLVFPPNGTLPGLQEVSNGISQKAAISIISNSLLSLAKIYQDGMSSSGASANAPRAISGVQETLALYYLSLSLQPSPSTANNVGILLAGVQHSAHPRLQVGSTENNPSRFPGVTPGSGVALALAYYDYGLKLDTRHAHLYTNLGSLFKDIGQLSAAVNMYEKAVDCDGNFDIALANLANAVKDKGNISDAIKYYKKAVASNPNFAEAVCGLANALNSVCSWSGRGGVSHVHCNRDRWHVNEEGMLCDSKNDLGKSSGWIDQVVSIVEKQLRDGKGWGKGVVKSFGIERMLQQLGLSSDRKVIGKLRQALVLWAEENWEGAKVVRFVERATKRLTWQIYRQRYISAKVAEASTYPRPQLPTALTVPSAPTVLPFHTFTCPLSAKQIRKISQRNGLRVSCSTLRASWLPTNIYQPPPPPSPQLNVGYISSDFNNHPLAHLMQSVFGLHAPSRVKAICYATTVSDGSIHRQQIERESPIFHDASSWSIERLVNQVVTDGIHILVNLNGYTRGAKNEVFAARPAPIQMSFMGFAGTLGAEWCDYLLADRMAIPPRTLRPWRGNVDLEDQAKDGNNDDILDDWVYGENIIFTRDTFFCCDHRQSAPDAQQEQLSWPEEQRRRWKMRNELFPDLAEDAIILGNFNQLYKVMSLCT